MRLNISVGISLPHQGDLKERKGKETGPKFPSPYFYAGRGEQR